MEEYDCTRNLFFAKRFGEKFTQNYADVYAEVPGTNVIVEFEKLTDDQVMELLASLKEVVGPGDRLCLLNIAFVLPTNELIEKWAPTLQPILETHKIDDHKLPLGTVISTFFRQAEETWSSPGYVLLRSGNSVNSVRTDYQASQVVPWQSHFLRAMLLRQIRDCSNPIYVASRAREAARIARDNRTMA